MDSNTKITRKVRKRKYLATQRQTLGHAEDIEDKKKQFLLAWLLHLSHQLKYTLCGPNQPH